MTTTDCRCPMPPVMDDLSADEIERIVGAPLRCTSCGQELELRCPEGHVHQAPRSPSPNHRPTVTPQAVRTCEAGHPLPKYKSRCRVCRPTVSPARTARPRLPGRVAARARQSFALKGCSCGRTFTPTGPNTKRCEVCRGVAT